MALKLRNMFSVSSRLIAIVCCVGALASNGQSVEITGFTGGDPGEGLDFEGSFLYSVNISGFGGQVLGDTEFTEDDDTDGFDIISTHDLPTWATPEYGDSDADDDLEEIMQSIRWSNVPDQPAVDIEMSVESGQAYKLQMLFTESCCDRGFDIFLDEELLVDDFAIYEHHEDDFWNIPSREDGVLITHEFTAASDLLFLQLGDEAEDFPDNNGHISALTLEIVSGGGVVGDFNGNGMRDTADLDLLAAAMGGNDAGFDLNGDGAVNLADREFWVVDLANTFMGDANFDGEFSSTDFVVVFGAAKYEKPGVAATWAEGDWNGDGFFTSSDFVTAFSGGGYEKGPNPGGLKVVPEPSGLILLALGICLAFRKCR